LVLIRISERGRQYRMVNREKKKIFISIGKYPIEGKRTGGDLPLRGREKKRYQKRG